MKRKNKNKKYIITHAEKVVDALNFAISNSKRVKLHEYKTTFYNKLKDIKTKLNIITDIKLHQQEENSTKTKIVIPNTE